MYAKLSDFISHVKAVGLPTSSHYYVELPAGFGDVRTVSMVCESAMIPGLIIMTNEIRTQGEAIEMPYHIAYENITLNFIEDNDFTARKYMESWLHAVYDRRTREVGYYDEYKRNIKIFMNDKAGNYIYCTELFDAYPKAISSLQVGYDNHSTPRTSVSFVYKYWVNTIVTPTGEPRGEFLPNSLPTGRTLEGISNVETLSNITGVGSSGFRAFGSATSGNVNVGSSMSALGSDFAGQFRRNGSAVNALMSSSGMSHPADIAIGQNLGGNFGSLGENLGKFGDSFSELGKNLSNITGPIQNVSRAVSGVAGVVNSIDGTLKRVGIDTKLSKIGKEINQTAGILGEVAQLGGVPGALGSVGANIGALSGEINQAIEGIKTIPGTTNQILGQLTKFSDSISRRGTDIANDASSLQSQIDNQ